MLEINEKNIKDYQQNGFVISESKLSENLFNKISKSYDEFISTNNDLTLEEMASPHLIGGTNKKHKVNEELSKSFLDIGTDSEIVEQIKKFLGPDVILWGMHVMHKPAKTGKKIPWHQDGTYWPINPSYMFSMDCNF